MLLLLLLEDARARSKDILAVPASVTFKSIWRDERTISCRARPQTFSCLFLKQALRQTCSRHNRERNLRSKTR